jgi:ABC-2 type transport system ATP-binding protein
MMDSVLEARMIQVTELRKSYGSTVAVDGISFDVRSGETFGLLGPNGAGKTTTLHMICGALRPDAGTITINGQANPTQEAVRRQLGIAPQAIALYEELTAEENLAFFGRLYGLAGSRLRERVGVVLQMAGLTERRRDAVKTFSGGMKRRLNLACALVHDPAVVFLDEPTAGVDPQSRNHLLDTITKLPSHGRAVIYTTHYMEEAQRLCDRVAIMDQGRMLALDTVDGLVIRHGGQALVEVELEHLPSDPATLRGTLDGHTLRIATDQPFEEGARLLAAGVKFNTFKVERPNLETVFLALTGRRLRD